jgi:hypothetical protein
MIRFTARAALAAAAAAMVWAVPAPALAYIGPGAGITMLGALWGVLAALVLALGAVLFWPTRAAIRSVRRRRPSPPAVGDAADADREPNP